MSSRVGIAFAIATVLFASRASAAEGDEEEPPPKAAVTPATVPDSPPVTAPLKVTPTGYVEAFYAYNFNRPSNGITNYRGFDNRHNTFSLSNAALGAFWEAGPVGGKIMLQIGSTPSSYYSAEPNLSGAGGANASNAELWKYIQEAYVTYKAPVGRGLLIQAGIVASPIGMEQFAVKDHWTWSRSNLFFGFPYYHTGVRATYEWSPELTSTVSVFNGWNNVVDNNEEKSVQTNTTYRFGEDAFVNLLYWGGIERNTGSPEGPNWRHHFDMVAQAKIFSLLTAAMQADYGFEPTRMGTASWWAVAGATRLRIMKELHFVLRGDRFHEHLATDATRSSTALFWGGAEWVTSGTATLDLRPYDQISFRLEGRHDIAEQPLYFRRQVDPATSAPNARTQTTVLLGVTAWF
jgi:hypothetical protein